MKKYKHVGTVADGQPYPFTRYAVYAYLTRDTQPWQKRRVYDDELDLFNSQRADKDG